MVVRWNISRKWIVLVACFLNMSLIGGFPFHMSVLNAEFLRTFQKSKGETALVQAVTAGMLRIAGFPSGQCVNKFGVLKMGICSGLLTSTGLVLSFFATSIPYLVASSGVLTGCGLSLGFVSTTTSVGEHFTGQARHIAMSFVVSAGGFGSMVFPFLLESLIQMYGWRGCLLIVGGVMGNTICLFAVCDKKTVSLKKRTPSISYIKDVSRDPKNRSYENDKNESEEQQQCSAKLKLVFKNYVFLIYCAATVCTLPWTTATLIYLIEFLKTKQFNEQDALSLYFWMNVASTVGRIIPGPCKHIPKMSVLMIPALFTSLSCCTVILSLFVETYFQHVSIMIGFGIAFGSSVTILPMATMKLVGLETYSVAIGVLMTIEGVCAVGIGFIAGWILDISGSFSAWFYCVASFHGLAACLYLVSATMRKCNRAFPIVPLNDQIDAATTSTRHDREIG